MQQIRQKKKPRRKKPGTTFVRFSVVALLEIPWLTPCCCLTIPSGTSEYGCGSFLLCICGFYECTPGRLCRAHRFGGDWFNSIVVPCQDSWRAGKSPLSRPRLTTKTQQRIRVLLARLQWWHLQSIETYRMLDLRRRQPTFVNANFVSIVYKSNVAAMTAVASVFAHSQGVSSCSFVVLRYWIA